MVNITRLSLNKPKTKHFEGLLVGEMFVDPEDLELMIKVSDTEGLMVDSNEMYGYNPDTLVQLCNVDIRYTLQYES